MENEKSISWLQFSDLHILKSVDWNLMMDSYRSLAKRLHPDFIVITGDYRHKKYEENYDYSETLEFLEEITKLFSVKKKDVFLVPGNHDVEDYEFRKDSIRGIIEGAENPEKYMEYLEKTQNLKMAFESYSNFVKQFYGDEVTDNRINNPDDVICLPWRDKINIIILNTALISDGNKEHGEIIDINALSKIEINKKLPTLVLGHHDFSSICESQKERMVKIFEKFNVRAYLCGDTHKDGIKFIDKYDDIVNKIPCIICGKSAVQLMDNYSDVGVISYNWNNDGFVYVIPYRWGEKYCFKKSNKFVYDIDKEYRFYMSEAKRELDSTSSCKVSKTYKNIIEAHNDIVSDIQIGGFLKFYGLRGATFIGESEINAIIKELKSNPYIQIRFLISYPFSEEIRHRLKDIPEFKSDDKCEEKWRDTYKKVNDLKQDYKDFNNVDIRFHDTTLIFRLLITQKHLYLGYYEPNKNSVNTAIYQFDNNTSTYQTYSAFFDYQWKKAKRSLPAKIPEKYSFLKEKFSVQPSLVINITSLCNMNCIYCPKGGENLCEIKAEECLPEDALRRLISVFKKLVKEKGDPILRITGGEPLYTRENCMKTAAILDAAKDYKKIVFCTNGVFLKEAYMSNSKQWDAVRSKLLLKISLDTLEPNRFCEITGTGKNGGELFNSIIENIKFANAHGFKIELNIVATKVNLNKAEDIIKIFDFARELGLIGVKVLTVNDFGGNVKIEQSEDEKKHISGILNDVIQKMKEREYEETEIYLNDNKGIQMRRFIAISDNDEKCTLTIVDHNNDSASLTPRRTFSDFCTSCKFFLHSEQVYEGKVKPCATGIMSLTLRSDGVLSPCRLCVEKGKNIKNIRSQGQMERLVKESLKAFNNCYHMNK